VPAPAPVAARPAAEERKTLVADAVVDATPQPAPAAPVRNVKDVRFEQKDGFVRLTIFLDDAAPVATKESPKGAEVPTLRVPRTALPENLERTLDVSDVAGGVLSAVSTYADGGDLVIAANIAPGTEHRHWAKKDRLMWDFRNRTAEMPTTKVAQYPEEVTSSYSAASAALQATSKLAPSKERYNGRRVSLDIKDADVQNVLRLLADVSKLNIVASDDVSGKITIKLRNVPWDQALDIVLRAKQLDKVRNGNIIRVAPVDVLAKEEKLRIDRAAQKIELEPLTVRLIPVSYSLASEIEPQVKSLLSTRGKVNIDARTNVLVVEDIAEVLLKAERLVRTLDTQTPQVLIESRIVEARSNFSRELGIQWGGSAGASAATNNATGLTFPNTIQVTGGSTDQATNEFGVVSPANYAVNLPAAAGSGTGGALGFTFGSLGGAALINVRLSAAEASGKVKIISAPRVVTLDNREAKIVSGEKIPITVITANGPTTRFIDANLELTVVPHVTQDGAVLLKVAAKKNELSDRRDNLGVPGIITKEADTVMIVRDGDTAVLGGIYRRTAIETKNYVPWLGQIPVLGWLFKKTQNSDARDELLIFISPRIVNRNAALVQTSS
ncbi:MAG: type IV pilus secretin PilQ, partial [Myxococcales bacterium]|nr:type IV pilus secretin PilQ [Myxococcales bacterium]